MEEKEKTQACISGTPDLLWFASCFRRRKEGKPSDDFPECLMDKNMENREQLFAFSMKTTQIGTVLSFQCCLLCLLHVVWVRAGKW